MKTNNLTQTPPPPMEDNKTMELIQSITNLTNQWYKLIGPEHHKDRDCHWYLNTCWSYGDEPSYVVKHNGYLLDPIEKSFPSHIEALKFLKSKLIKAIEEEKLAQKDSELEVLTSKLK
jgi:hypothetical protein